MAFLDSYWDPAIEVDLSLDVDKVALEERERLARMHAVAVVASQIPRRLSDATRDELAMDKKRSRRIAHALAQSLTAWAGVVEPPTDEDRRNGAQIDWEPWWEEHCAWLEHRLRYVASWAKATGNLRFGKSAVVKLSQELAWLKYAMRD